MIVPSRSATSTTLTLEHLDDLKRAAAKMLGDRRRVFQAEMTVKYCGSNARQAETVLGWNRQTEKTLVEIGEEGKTLLSGLLERSAAPFSVTEALQLLSDSLHRDDQRSAHGPGRHGS